MKMVTVQTFLCCFKLEVCGYLVGWFGSIFASLGLLLVIIAGGTILLNFENFGELIRNQGFEINFVADWIIDKALTFMSRELNEKLRVLWSLSNSFIFSFHNYCFHNNCSTSLCTPSSCSAYSRHQKRE